MKPFFFHILPMLLALCLPVTAIPFGASAEESAVTAPEPRILSHYDYYLSMNVDGDMLRYDTSANGKIGVYDYESVESDELLSSLKWEFHYTGGAVNTHKTYTITPQSDSELALAVNAITKEVMLTTAENPTASGAAQQWYIEETTSGIYLCSAHTAAPIRGQRLTLSPMADSASCSVSSSGTLLLPLNVMTFVPGSEINPGPMQPPEPNSHTAQITPGGIQPSAAAQIPLLLLRVVSNKQQTLHGVFSGT